MIERRDIAKMAFAGVVSAGLATKANAAVSKTDAKSMAAKSAVLAFYSAYNKGLFGVLSNLLDEFARGQSSSGFFVADPNSGKNGAPTTGHTQLGGKNGWMETKAELLEHWEVHQKKTGRTYNINSDDGGVYYAGDGYVIAWVYPTDISMMGVPIPMIHVFWCRIDDQEGAIVECRIGGFYESELRDLGRNYE